MMASALVFFMLACLVPGAAGAQATIVVTDDVGAAARVAAPVGLKVDLKELSIDAAGRTRFLLREVTDASSPAGPPIAAQFEPEAPGSTRGTLWWLMPPGGKGARRFHLEIDAKSDPTALRAHHDQTAQSVDVAEENAPVLRYNHGTVPPPPEIVARFEQGQEHPLYYARGGYIHPLFGPNGEEITDDYSLNHPHHRGVFWAWPVLRYKDEVRDHWAVRVLPSQPGGAWTRPVALRRVESGDVLAVIDAESVWKWGDREPIVREEVVIRAFRSHERSRFVDIELYLTALVEGVSIGGRPKVGYGGFGVRSFPEFPERRIGLHVDPPGESPRRAWFHLTGVFPGATAPAGMALLEHVSNPGYPSYPNPEGLEGIPEAYPPWRCVLPCFPGDREVALTTEKPLALKYRLWIHASTVDEERLVDVWTSYADPPTAPIAP
ncbi:MAG: DUF6807 family protein [Planctomycetota bacterium]